MPRRTLRTPLITCKSFSRSATFPTVPPTLPRKQLAAQRRPARQPDRLVAARKRAGRRWHVPCHLNVGLQRRVHTGLHAEWPDDSLEQPAGRGPGRVCRIRLWHACRGWLDAGLSADRRGDGGFNSILIDTSYTSRNLGKYISLGLDWLWGYAGLTTSLEQEASGLLVRWSDCVRDHGYYANSPASNYGAGGYVDPDVTALALSGGRSDQGGRLLAEVNYYRQANVVPLLQNPLNSLKGGFWAEGWSYGELAAENILLAGAAYEAAGRGRATAERQWASEVIRSLLEQQPTQATIYDGGDWFANPAPVPAKSLFTIAAVLADDPAARAYANYAVLMYPQPPAADFLDLLNRDPAAACRVAVCASPCSTAPTGPGTWSPPAPTGAMLRPGCRFSWVTCCRPITRATHRAIANPARRRCAAGERTVRRWLSGRAEKPVFQRRRHRRQRHRRADLSLRNGHLVRFPGSGHHGLRSGRRTCLHCRRLPGSIRPPPTPAAGARRPSSPDRWRICGRISSWSMTAWGRAMRLPETVAVLALPQPARGERKCIRCDQRHEQAVWKVLFPGAVADFGPAGERRQRDGQPIDYPEQRPQRA